MKKFFFPFILCLSSLAGFAQLTAPSVDALPDNSTPTSVKIAVNDGNATAINFEVAYSGPTNGTVLVPWRAGNSVITIPSLMPNSNYTINVRTLNCATAGCSPSSLFSVARTIRTLSLNPGPVNINFTNNCPGFVGVNWVPVDRPGDITSFIIQKSYGAGFFPVVEKSGSEYVYYDNDVVPGKTVTYRIFSFTNSGFYVTTSAPFTITPYSAPPPAVNLRSEPSGKTDKSVTIAWANQPYDTQCGSNKPDAVYVQLKRKGDADFKTIEVLNPTAIKQVITGLTPKEIFDVRLLYVSDKGIQSQMVVLRDTTAGKPFPPSDLIGVAFKDALNNSAIGLSWKDNSRDEDFFQVEYSTDSLNFKVLGKILANNTSFKHQPIEEGVKYYYRVKAGNFIYGDSEYTPITFGIKYNISSIPNAPYGLSSVQGTGLKVNLKWADDANNEESIVLDRNVDGGAFTELKKFSKNTTTYIDADVLAGKTYGYRLKAVNSIGSSAFSVESFVQVKASTTNTIESEVSLLIYPNPTTDLLKVDLSKTNLDANNKIQIVDANNRIVYSKSFGKKVFDLDVNTLKEGLYTLQILGKVNSVSTRFYKK
jgi:hypothetical protein